MGSEAFTMLGIFVPIASGGVIAAYLALRFKLKEKELEMRGGDTIDALRDDLDDTRAQLAEMQERLDFAERMLTAGRAPQDEKANDR